VITRGTSAAASGGGWPPDFSAWQSADWSALAAWVTVAVAVIVAIIALSQLRLARRLRKEQARPYVAAYMEGTPHHERFIDLVVANFGKTMAKDVRLQVTPAPRSSVQGGEPQDLWLPECIPALAPGQVWRTLWDFFPERAKADLPSRHEAVLTYTDAQGDRLDPTPSILDWAAYRGRLSVTTYDLHDAAEALREIGKILGTWQEDIHGGLSVFVRDGDTKDERQREQAEALRAARRAEQAQQQGEPEESQ